MSQSKQRRQWSVSDKMRIVLAGMEAGTEISEMCPTRLSIFDPSVLTSIDPLIQVA